MRVRGPHYRSLARCLHAIAVKEERTAEITLPAALLSSRTPPLRISLALLLITNTCGSLRVTITKSRKIKIHGPPHPYRTSLCKHTLPLLSSLSHLHGPFGVVPILSGDGEPLFVISICGTPFCFFEGD